MDKKVFWFDVETTGLDPVHHDIIQLAFLIEIGGEIAESGNMFMQPFNYVNISPESLDVHGRTIEELKSFKRPQDSFSHLINILSKYINRYDPHDKFYPAGYNSRFDIDFLMNFFKKNHDPFYGSWFYYKAIDPLPILHMLDSVKTLSLDNYKLPTVCNHFNITLNPHDACSDISATRTLTEKILSKYFKFED